MAKLKFGRANAKVVALQRKMKGKVYTFDTLSGYACPFAHNCLSKAVVGPDGKRHIKDGPHTLFRCFSASQEALFTNVYNARKANFDALRGLSSNEMRQTIVANLPFDAKIIRIHVAGDFFNQANFDAWLAVAKQYPHILFYAYTKSLPYWVARLDVIPTNFVLTASEGGRRDDLIVAYNLRFVRVVGSVYQARKAKLPIDHDDSHAAKSGGNFALLIHGSQPAGSAMSKAKQKLKGKGSYSRKLKNKGK